jgi:hypothetical protein
LYDSAWPAESFLGADIGLGIFLGFHVVMDSSCHISQA